MMEKLSTILTAKKKSSSLIVGKRKLFFFFYLSSVNFHPDELKMESPQKKFLQGFFDISKTSLNTFIETFSPYENPTDYYKSIQTIIVG